MKHPGFADVIFQSANSKKLQFGYTVTAHSKSENRVSPVYSQFQWIILTSLWTNGTVDIHHWQSQPQQRPARNRSAFAHRGQKVVLNSKKTQACARWSWTQALCVITLQTRIPLSHRLHLLSMDPNFGDHGIYIYIYTVYMVCIQDKFHDLC